MAGVEQKRTVVNEISEVKGEVGQHQTAEGTAG